MALHDAFTPLVFLKLVARKPRSSPGWKWRHWSWEPLRKGGSQTGRCTGPSQVILQYPSISGQVLLTTRALVKVHSLHTVT